MSGLISSAKLSPCKNYRYMLLRDWDCGPTCRFVMLNPSTADAHVDDPTIRRCIGFAKRAGFGSLEVLNLFALRATDPTWLRTFKGCPFGPSNDFTVESRLDEHLADDKLVLAWGSNIPAKYRKTIGVRVQAWVKRFPAYCLGLTKQGQPKHPLYVPNSAPWLEVTHVELGDQDFRLHTKAP